MVLAVIFLINNLGLFILEVIGYHACHSGMYPFFFPRLEKTSKGIDVFFPIA